MNRNVIWRILLIIGLIPFAAPFLGFAYEMLNASSWTLGDWLIMYSFVYWPTYLAGLVLILLSVYKLIR